MIREYFYDDLKQMESLDVSSEQISINGVSINDIDEMLIHDSDDESILIRLIAQNKEIASFSLTIDEKLVVDDSDCYLVIPKEGIELS